MGKEVYRNLVKGVKKHIRREEHKAHFTDFIIEEFRTSNNTEAAVAAAKKGLSQTHQEGRLKLAKDYTFLLNSVHHQKDLLFSNKISVNRSDEMKRVLRKSAASVGLQLPEAYHFISHDS
ncbi:unnamed protein product [Cuscuta epithymum]|uniref:Uncharacterized protein n=1 Tax=Cuscuta epithymum TaxID=186058 RepID=A0AAV0G0H9_9ASTE|nr:unnamed protein product [Cuscuta epithymum]CAH9141439.1 unnamed protein product [Cuscuta epithymum]CAH9147505.1 unnamed protein product [Cuscuta epithymum]